MEDIILVGGGGHCKSVIDTITNKKEFNIIGIIDQLERVGTYVNDIEVIGVDDDLPTYFLKGIKYAFITIGSIGDIKLRKLLYNYCKDIGYHFPTIIDNTAIISTYSNLKEGSYIGKGTIINSDVEIGINTIINTGTIIEHDCKIGDFCHIAPGSTISGSVIIGNNTHIGTNTTIIQNLKIGNDSLIGAGSVVTNNIASNVKAYGNPCKVVNSH